MENASIVWIVDDDNDDQMMIEMAFKEVVFPLVIKQLSDGDELLPQLEEAPSLPKLILLDLNMQRKNGFDVLAELRSIPAYRKLPVVVLTTSDNEADKRKSLALGANDFLTKPSSIKAVIHMLRRLVSDWNLN
ncbi:response regulator [Spirosoma utsteinense]|uniref:CheY-like chemotaxis protein n=1 Tax=Spirosoma utsteinense TaxID=2585773 RepID=A0ABR6WET3_9BACT|nr:response regulator [Spirosoma utsteinense]MBC3789138.1 CheY-like chemotaxis protein [Spirosoma utsteinense]MBC3795060.1 CheY-like chemotaxis protein [Spirosoma utsteinense]